MRQAVSLLAVVATLCCQSDSGLVNAVREGKLEDVRTLLAQGADCNAKDKEGLTALTWSLRRCHEFAGKDNARFERYRGILQLLVKARARFSSEDYYQLGALYGRAGSHEEALKAFRAATQVNPNCAECFRSIGFALASLKRFEEALEAYGQAVRLKPDFATAYLNLAYAFHTLKRYEEGLLAYSRVAELDPALAKSNAPLLLGLMTRPVVDAGQRIILPGFSVLPPKGENWTVMAVNNAVTFNKETGKGAQHTVIAFARLESIASERGATAAKLLGRLRSAGENKYRDQRFRALKLRTSPLILGGVACVKVSFSVEDTAVPWAPGGIFALSGEDIYCIHPEASPPRMVQVSFSQRFPKGERPLPLDPEVAPFLESLAFSPVRQ